MPSTTRNRLPHIQHKQSLAGARGPFAKKIAETIDNDKFIISLRRNEINTNISKRGYQNRIRNSVQTRMGIINYVFNLSKDGGRLTVSTEAEGEEWIENAKVVQYRSIEYNLEDKSFISTSTYKIPVSYAYEPDNGQYIIHESSESLDYLGYKIVTIIEHTKDLHEFARHIKTINSQIHKAL